MGQIDASLRALPIPPTPGAIERIRLAQEQLRALVAAKGDHGLLIARKHMGWTCQGFAGAAQLRHALMRAPGPAQAEALLELAAQGAAEGRELVAGAAGAGGGVGQVRCSKLQA